MALEQAFITFGNDKSSASIFPFFALPRELRDIIYNQTLDREKSMERGRDQTANFYNLPHPHLLRINQQFREELLEWVPKHTRMVLEDPHPSTLVAPLQLQYVSHVEIHVGLHCPCHIFHPGINWCLMRSRLSLVQRLFNSTKTLWGLHSISANLYFGPHRNGFDRQRIDTLLTHQSEFAMIMGNKRLKALNVYMPNEAHEARSRCGSKADWRKDAVLVMKYSPGTRRLLLVAPPEEN
jgi:hypothetical protein